MVRWGGAIASVENRRDETWIEIVERPLNTDKSAGRFLARVDGFLDPAVRVEHVYLWPLPSRAARHYYRSPYWYDPWYPWGYPHPYRRPR